MTVFGVDPHKQSHTAVAADELGRKKAQKTARARRDGHRELIAWARELAPAGRAWAVQDVRHVAGGLIRELPAAGEQVVFVPPKLMAGERRGGRERGRSGPIDALAIARLALREEGRLPAARLDEQVLEVRRLADHRDDLVAERTRVINRLRWMVHDLDPELAPAPRSPGSARARAKLEAGPAALPAGAGQRVALSRLARTTALSAEITQLEKDLAAAPVLPGGVVLRWVTADGDMHRIATLQSAVWGQDWSWLGEDLIRRIAAAPDDIAVLAAEAGSAVVSAAWLAFFQPGADSFARLLGGSTLPQWRGRGIYRALVAARAQRAAARSVRYLQVDASDDSAPILRRLGFRAVTTATAYLWTPPPPTSG